MEHLGNKTKVTVFLSERENKTHQIEVGDLNAVSVPAVSLKTMQRENKTHQKEVGDLNANSIPAVSLKTMQRERTKYAK